MRPVNDILSVTHLCTSDMHWLLLEFTSFNKCDRSLSSRDPRASLRSKVNQTVFRNLPGVSTELEALQLDSEAILVVDDSGFNSKRRKSLMEHGASRVSVRRHADFLWRGWLLPTVRVSVAAIATASNCRRETQSFSNVLGNGDNLSQSLLDNGANLSQFF